MTPEMKYPRKKSTPTDLCDAVAPVRERHRELIDAAVAWQAGRGRQTDPDHFALICAVVDTSRRYADVTLTRWTRTGVHGTVRCDIPNWCSMRGTLRPETLCEVVWEWLDFLHATGRLDPQSDPVAELRKPLARHGWLDQDGRRMASDAARQIKCECFLPYRETVELLGEIVRRSEYSGEDPLDALHRVVGRPAAPRWSPLGDDGAELDGAELDGLGLDGYGSVGLLDPDRPDPWPNA